MEESICQRIKIQTFRDLVEQTRLSKVKKVKKLLNDNKAVKFHSVLV